MAKVPEVYAQKEQMNPMDEVKKMGKDVIDKAKDALR